MAAETKVPTALEIAEQQGFVRALKLTAEKLNALLMAQLSGVEMINTFAHWLTIQSFESEAIVRAWREAVGQTQMNSAKGGMKL